MSKNTLLKRRIILFFTVIAFCIISFSLVFYAFGFRVNLKTNEIREVGIIDIVSTPKNVEVYIDEKESGTKTPHQIGGLLPDTYLISIKKEGYSLWSKSVKTTARRVTWIRDARLFLLDQKEKKESEKKFSEIIPSHEPDTLALISGNKKEIYIFDKKDEDLNKVFETEESETIENIPAFHNNDFLLAKITSSDELSETEEEQKSTLRIIDIKGESTTKISSEELNDAKKIEFDQNNINKLLFLKNNTLFEYNAKTNKVNEIKNNVETFTNNKNRIFTASKNQITIEKKEGLFSDNEIESTIDLEKTDSIKQIQVNQENDIATINLNNTLTIISNNEVIGSETDVNKVTFAKNSRKILFRSENKAHFIEISDTGETNQAYKTNTFNLLTEYNEPILDANWHPDNAWVWINRDNNYSFIELDERSTRNTFSPQINTKNPLFFNQKGSKIFYINNSNELTSLELFEEEIL